MRTETLNRLSRGSSEVQVSQSQAIEGTPVEVPVPKNVSFMVEVQSPMSKVQCQITATVSFELLNFGIWTLDIGHWTLDFSSYPPVMSRLEKLRAFGVAFVNDTNCMRRSASSPSRICCSCGSRLPRVFCCSIPNMSIQCFPSSRSISRFPV